MSVFTRWLGMVAFGATVTVALCGWTAESRAQTGVPRAVLTDPETPMFVQQEAPQPGSASSLLPDEKSDLTTLVEPTPGAETKETKKEETKDAKKKDEPKSAWLTHPKVQVFPRPGFFYVPPTGCGYYSLCDRIDGNRQKAAPKSGYLPSFGNPPGFFDADFRYVDDPKYRCKAAWWEQLHRIHYGDDWLFATGGELRYRYSNELNRRLNNKDNTYDLLRVRTFGDLWYQDKFRIYVEGITAQTFNQDLPPLIFDRNYADLLNAFIDVKVSESCAGDPTYVRVGRQQLLLGSQRSISTLDWVNTLRTFQGVRAFHRTEKWDLDLFWVQPIIPNARRFDSVDNNQNFAGLWYTQRPEKGKFFDLYYLFLDNTNNFNPVTKTPPSVGPLATAPYNVHTLGARYAGNVDNVLYDFEGMAQAGRHGPATTIAGSTATGVGYNFKDAPWNPTVWGYYDWASGRGDPKGRMDGTFNQLYPFGHYYLGWLDLVGRQNIHDVNFHLYLNPAKWITFNAQYHIFHLDSARDALYNAAGTPSRSDPTGASGRYVGQEWDFITNFHVSRQSDIMLAYSRLSQGTFLRNTGPNQRNPESLWLIYNIRW